MVTGRPDDQGAEIEISGNFEIEIFEKSGSRIPSAPAVQCARTGYRQCFQTRPAPELHCLRTPEQAGVACQGGQRREETRPGRVDEQWDRLGRVPV